MKEILLDVVNHVNGIASIDCARITGSKDETLIDAIDEKRTVVIRGKIKNAVKDFNGEFGIGRLNVLKGWLSFANFKSDEAEVQVTRNTRNEIETPEELIFSNQATGNKAVYRFMHPDSLPAKAHFKQVDWDVVVEPTTSKINEFNQLATILSGTENFSVKTDGTNLVFYIGDAMGANDRVSCVFAADVSGTLNKGWNWPVVQVMQIIKLGDASKMKIKFSDAGAMMISMSTDYAEYEYILPAKLK